MRRLKRALAIGLTLVLVIGGAIGVAVFRRSQRVVAERAESLARFDAVRMKPTLTAQDACWLIKHWVHHGKGRAGLRPLVTCEGGLVEVAGGLRAERVLAESDFMQGHHVRELCLVRTDTWEVLGDAWHYGGCNDLPKGTARQIDAALSAGVAAEVQKVRAQLVKALETIALAPEACPAGLVVDPEQLVSVDADRLSGVDGPGPVPHDLAFSLCAPQDGGVRDPALAEFVCGRGRRLTWTHALVHQVELVRPTVVDEGRFLGGTIEGQVALVDLSKAQAVCRAAVSLHLPQVVVGRRGLASVELSIEFDELVRSGLADAKRRLVGR
ncbi:MAG: hypothetical protein SFW67_12355 [Myxococcaceae bacterium]|nr:hypothetical protein [Myxococcaceae bacterium]